MSSNPCDPGGVGRLHPRCYIQLLKKETDRAGKSF